MSIGIRHSIAGVCGSIALALVISGFGTTAALAEVCQYSDGTRDLGPCMQFENSGSANNYDLWCYYGPTSRSHKIVMNHTDSFTCRVPDEMWRNAAKTYYNDLNKHWIFGCDDDEKHVVKLIRTGAPGEDGTWETECRALQSSLSN